MKIAIIGGKGQMGKMFAEAFKKKGCEVILTGRRGNNIDAAKKADIIIVSVPIRETVKVIEEIASHIKEDALLTDFTSIKVKPMDAMKTAKCGILGGHPLFDSTVGFKSQNFILCPLKENNNSKWYRLFLKSLGLNIIELSAEEHDKNMAVIQGLTHISNISLGYALKKLGYNLDMGEKLSSPVYLLRLYTAGRILAQDEKLYSDIEMENPYSKETAKAYLEAVKEIESAVEKGSKSEFERIFTESRQYFGDKCKKARDLTGRVLNFMAKNK
ncbi:MAG TPA: prephenate dehydrogenase/arogenate dehydrogenase family protein [Nanoarchaeota archaeon]|nr:prephenate dehydrogenase/arogenate dehydrogenase family protein [Nanoarchaeota archaeon]